MFQLQIYLDKLRNKSDSKIDTEHLLSLFNNPKIGFSTEEAQLFEMLKKKSSVEEWNNISSIIKGFNINWDNRGDIHREIENVLSEEDFKKADEIIKKYTGALKIETQYLNLRNRYFKKSSIVRSLNDLNFDEGYILFKRKCNLNMVDNFNEYREKSLDLVVNSIENKLSIGDFNCAENIYNKQQLYISEDVYKDLVSKNIEIYKRELLRDIEEKLKGGKFEDADNVFRKTQHIYVTRENIDLIPMEFYSVMKKKYVANNMINEFKLYRFENANELFRKHTLIFSEIEFENLKRECIDVEMLNSFKDLDFKSATKIYYDNINSINKYYILIKKEYENKTENKIMDYLSGFYFSEADTLYNNNLPWIAKMNYEFIKVKYLIDLNILELRKLVGYYKGFIEQKNKSDEILDCLRRYYSSYSDYFENGLIEEIRGLKCAIVTYDEKKLN